MAQGAGFESHWEASYFRTKASQCRQLASAVPDAGIRATLEEMAADFDAQGDIAAEAAKSIPRAAESVSKRVEGPGSDI